MKNRTMERSNSADYNNDDNEYNPFENREVSKPLKYRDGIFHLVAAFISRGLITLPLAIHKAGLLCSFVFVSFLWICYPYIIHCLMVTKHRVEKDSKVPYLSYPKLVYIAFQTGPMFFKSIAKYVRLVTIVFYLFYHVVKCLTVTTDICLIVAKIYGLEYKDDKALMSLYKFLLLVPIILMTYFIKTLRGVNFAAYIAVICHTICLFTLFVIIYFIGYETLSLKNIIWIGSFADVLELVVLSTYSLEPLGLFIAVERNLDQPELFYGFTGLLSTANFGILVILIFLSILGSIVPHDAKNDDELKG
ncbi:hypothetical protein O3M35_002025 [Rhynocoris fuscipes]|uniref:Amino acid transporter transmembrane domain-containing protein n=1 Tax=Rhynocoris fuscipes TaxID=488301 RepID=A0AAW1CQH4_9HEMI